MQKVIHLTEYNPRDIVKFMVLVPRGFKGEYISQNQSFAFYECLEHNGQKENAVMPMILEVFFPGRKNGLEIDDVGLNAIADRYCAIFSLLYGKNIYNLGISMYNEREIPICLGKVMHKDLYPVYSKACRVDFGIELDFSLLKNYESLIVALFDDQYQTLYNAIRLYHRAIKNMDRYPEYTYLDYIGVGEAMSFLEEFSEEELLENDDELKKLIVYIRANVSDDKTRTNFLSLLRNRLYKIKRRFILTILKYLTDDFYIRSEMVTDDSLGKITKENIRKALSKTYDLRSKCLHMGEEIGYYISPMKLWHNEVVVGAFYHRVDSEGHPAQTEIDKLLQDALTLIGLERVMRYCLISSIKSMNI